MATSGTALFAPTTADLIVECFARIQIYTPALQTTHLVEARRSSNIILSDWSANRGVNLWSVEPIHIGLDSARHSYYLPDDTIQLLDVYVRTYDSAITSQTPQTLGTGIAPMTAAGVPIVGAYGDPAILGPGSGSLSSTKNSQSIAFRWPYHGLQPGDPIYFPYIASIGGLSLTGLYVVDFVVDSDTFIFNALDPAYLTSAGQGATPLVQTTEDSDQVMIVYPSHGKRPGDTFTVWTATTVGGITLSGDYEVQYVTTPYQFTVVAANAATNSDATFIDGGYIKAVGRYSGSAAYMDRNLGRLSRNEYAAINNKLQSGTTNSFWLNRIIPPVISVWPVPTDGNLLGLVAYRMRQLQDASPVNGTTLDMPNRFLPAFTAELTSSLAEKFQPAAFPEKAALAVAAWTRASQQDTDLVPLHITPGLAGYFR